VTLFFEASVLAPRWQAAPGCGCRRIMPHRGTVCDITSNKKSLIY
jgi:hypothetical protein